MFNNKIILITGGTGTLGRALTKYFFDNHKDLKKLIIYSRDEQKQFLMSQEYPKSKFPNIRFLIGDVRDKERLSRAFKDVDFVIHTAAMKHVHIAEYNPDECIKTNVGGAQNVIYAALENSVKNVIALSTDKACAPINLYGATKLTSDKLFIAANNVKGKAPIKFSVVRYGNVMGSNGSVIPFFLKIQHTGTFPITSPDMTRFNITIQQGVNMVIHALTENFGGEIFIPKIPSYKILDIASAIDPKIKLDIIGVRPGEKIHEEMISTSDSFNTYDLGDYYVILPNAPIFDLDNYIKSKNALKVKSGFSYASNTNDNWETPESLREKINKL